MVPVINLQAHGIPNPVTVVEIETATGLLDYLFNTTIYKPGHSIIYFKHPSFTLLITDLQEWPTFIRWPF